MFQKWKINSEGIYRPTFWPHPLTLYPTTYHNSAREKQVFFLVCWRVFTAPIPYSAVPRQLSPLLDGLLRCPPSSSSPCRASDQSWPLCHSRPSGGSSPSPTTTLPAGSSLSDAHTWAQRHGGIFRNPHADRAPPQNAFWDETRAVA